MANTIRDYSATPANNTVVDGADISEGCSPAGINDAIRGVMSDLKDVSTGAVALESPAADSLSVTGNVSAATFSGDGSSLTGIPTPTLTSLGIANHDDITVDGSGNVGIGTSSPSNILHVSGTSGTPVLLERTNGSACTLAFKGNATTNNPYLGATSDDLYFNTGNAERLRIDASGRVTMPYQPVFSANRSGLATVNNINSNVNFTPVVNQGNHWNTSTHTFTCPVAGKYWVSVFNLTYTGVNSGASIIQINKNNGTVFTAYQDSPAGTNYHNSSASGVFACAANDTITFFSPSGIVYGDQYCGATVYLIG